MISGDQKVPFMINVRSGLSSLPMTYMLESGTYHKGNRRNFRPKWMRYLGHGGDNKVQPVSKWPHGYAWLDKGIHRYIDSSDLSEYMQLFSLIFNI